MISCLSQESAPCWRARRSPCPRAAMRSTYWLGSRNNLIVTIDPPARSAKATLCGRRASLQAKLVRLGGRWLLRHHGRNDVTIEKKRRRAATAARLVPKPPGSTRTLAVDADGVSADRVSTPLSERCRHILF